MKEEEEVHQNLEGSKPPDTLFIRMITGEDLIADVVWNDDSVCFINPMKILYVLGEAPGTLKLSLIQWVFPKICRDQEFIINTEDILTMAPLSDELLEYYLDSVDRYAKGKGVIIESYKNEDSDEENEDEVELVKKYQEKKRLLN